MPAEHEQHTEEAPETGSGKLWEQRRAALLFLSRLFADMAGCVRFFSRLPLPAVNALDDPAALPRFEKIARAAPLAGAFVALPAAGLGLALGYTHLPALAIAVLIAALLAITTGALHEDGLSDVADGFFGGHTTARRLEIMKDSRIGAFGALALVLSVALRVALYAALWQRLTPAEAALTVLTGEAVSRALLVWQWHTLPSARPEGLAARFGTPSARTVSGAVFVTSVLLIPALLTLPLPALLTGLVLAAMAAFGVGRLARDKIGGATGDVLGAIQQISGLGFLLGLLMVT